MLFQRGVLGTGGKGGPGRRQPGDVPPIRVHSGRRFFHRGEIRHGPKEHTVQAVPDAGRILLDEQRGEQLRVRLQHTHAAAHDIPRRLPHGQHGDGRLDTEEAVPAAEVPGRLHDIGGHRDMHDTVQRRRQSAQRDPLGRRGGGEAQVHRLAVVVPRNRHTHIRSLRLRPHGHIPGVVVRQIREASVGGVVLHALDAASVLAADRPEPGRPCTVGDADAGDGSARFHRAAAGPVADAVRGHSGPVYKRCLRADH